MVRFPHSMSPENPLQRMASITNSLVSQPLPSPSLMQQKLKAVLPPITQQQVKRTTRVMATALFSSVFAINHNDVFWSSPLGKSCN